MSDVDKLGAALAEHLWADRRGQTCSCGWDYDRAPGNTPARLTQWTQHVAERILATRMAEPSIRAEDDAWLRRSLGALIAGREDGHKIRTGVLRRMLVTTDTLAPLAALSGPADEHPADGTGA